ncbi:MAG: glycosyltransferase family 4 protein [Aureliella sp.]
MRVLHIITRMIIGGAQENTLYNCIDLVEQHGDDVLLATGPTLGREGKLLTEGRAGGLNVIEVPSLQRAIHPPRDRAAYRELTKVIKDYKPDVVHTHSAKGGFIGRSAAWKQNVPAVIHSVHGAPFHPYQNPLSRQLFIMLERWAAKRCHRMICVADAMTDLMVAANVAPREKFTTICSGMDVAPFQNCGAFRDDARQELGFDNDDIVFGKIARLFNLKGHEYLVDAAAKVVAENPKCRFLLVGDGILREELEQRIAKHGLEGHFTFTGLVPPERIPYYLSSMDCLVHTSLREGLARTLPQALISGRPVISYDVDGAREVAIDGVTGFLLAPRAIEPLADAILTMAADRQRREAMGQEGAKRFTQQFRHQNMTQQIRDVYQQILNNS